MPDGSPPTGVSKGTRERLIEALVKHGVKREEIERAFDMQRRQGGSFSQHLLTMKLVESQVLASIMGKILQIPVINLSKMEIDAEVSKFIPRKQAFQYEVVPISCIGSHLTVAMTDPMDVTAIDYLNQLTGLTLAPLIATAEEIQDALVRLYGGAIKDTLEELKEDKTAAAALDIHVISVGVESGIAESAAALIKLTQEGPIVKLTNAILTESVALKASDILIESFEKRFRIRYRVDGSFREGDSPPLAMNTGVVSRVKVMANLNITEHRLPQDGRIKFSIGGRQVDFRVSVIPSYYGEKICMRVLDKGQVMLDIDKLGFDASSLKFIKDAVSHPHGLVLTTGPTGSGKTTTMYSLLKLIDRPDRNIVTVEDPVEFDLPGINQVAIHPEIGLTFGTALRSILRQDPNIVMVGEIRDEETSDISVKAALTGHLVLSTLHTNDAIGAVARLVNMGVEPYLVASCLLFVGAQRLPRRVCIECQEPFVPSQEMIQQLGLPPDGTYRRGKGCGKCRGSGFLGRVGLLEAIFITPTLRRLIAQRATAAALKEVARQEGFRSLRDSAMAKAAAGIIPLEEVARTTVGYQE